MRQPDPLAGLVLLARSAEQIEDALVIAGIAIVILNNARRK